MAGRWVVTLMVNTNRNRESQPLALTWPASAEELRDVLSFFVVVFLCPSPSLPPSPTHQRSRQSSESRPVHVCDECA